MISWRKLPCKNFNLIYTNLREYVYTYIRINKKITIAKNQLITDVDLLYPGLTAMAKKKFDYCIIDSELSVIKRGILINNNNGFSEK